MSFKKTLLIGAAGLAAYGLVRRAMRRDVREYFVGKSVVVTGGASGIGFALVARLREYGARILVVDVDDEALARVEAEVPIVETLKLDLASNEGPRAMIDAAVDRLGGADVVFSNAGIIWAAPFLKMTDDDIRKLIDVNFTMQVRMTHELLPYFIERGGGVIAYTGSLSSYVYSPMHSVYTGTKGGLNGFVAAVRRELPAASGVQLTIVHPNITRTDLISDEVWDEVTLPMQTPIQVADALLQGVADSRKQVFVEIIDHAIVGVERYAPAAVNYVFRTRLENEELQAKAEAAIPNSKLRKQIASASPTSPEGGS